MSLTSILTIAGSGLTAETQRMTASASNMTNANVLSGRAEDTYKAQYPIFKAIQENAMQSVDNKLNAGVVVTGVYASDAEPIKHYEPNNPLANEEGFVFSPNISYVDEMANMISASRAYQINLEMISSAKQMIQRTLQVGQ